MQDYKPYNSEDVESRIYRFWEDNNLFVAKAIPEKSAFSMVMPPPNITGALHLGHALDLTLSDVVVRYNYLKGKEVLWLPGIDQAGIATQNVVEKELAKNGISRETLGREKFIEEVWNWKEKYGGRIIEQIKLLGAASDWSRLRFTKDEKYEKAVRTAFEHYYKKGLIYKGKRIINWCPRCETALSDIEVDYVEEKGKLYYIRYPIENTEGFVVVATTRPETMLGDTAVAVNPNDNRYKGIIGKYVILPIIGRRIPIIEDEAVDPAFGTGAVKVTPAHDPVDFDIGKRHNLEEVSILIKGKILNQNAGKFEGLRVEDARKEVIKELESLNLLEKVEDYIHSVGTCERCSSKVEPLISDQWFLKTKGLADEAVKRVESGEVQFKPERWKKVFIDWMENIQDWCISRQIWWGIQIPVWYCNDCGEIIVSVENPTECIKCGSTELTQDSDVLDTWFGSALWPFASMGWPEDSLELKNYYPTSLLITGFDIIFFWVARMIFSAVEFTGSVPFKEVLLHGLIRDKYGKKMSKSSNNAVDPEDLISNYGADALRFTLITGSSIGGQDINFDVQKVIASRNFINKIWNAGRFVFGALESSSIDNIAENSLSVWDKWIIFKLKKTIKEVAESISSFRLNEGALSIYNFFWDDFCDWYIEESKINLNKKILGKVFEESLILLHPFMPFVTEELWQMLKGNNKDSILKSGFPEANEKEISIYEESLLEVELLKEIIRGIRNLKSEFNLSSMKEIDMVFTSHNDKVYETIEKNKETILRLAKIRSFEYVKDSPANVVSSYLVSLDIYLPLKDLLDINREIEIKSKKLEKINSELSRLDQRFWSKDFQENAPEDVLNKTKERILELDKEKEHLTKRIEELRKIF
jgi:valyl-tRNA synthetase